MRRPKLVVPYILTLVAVVVCVDILFFSHQLLPRLVANIGMVVVFATFFLRFLKRR